MAGCGPVAKLVSAGRAIRRAVRPVAAGREKGAGPDRTAVLTQA